ncbi:MAG: hypothetical protein AAGG57_19460 [Pseudomonadota bacterium]
MIVYSHRFQGVIQQVVLELGLELTLADSDSPVSLLDNEKMFSDLAVMMNVDLSKQMTGSTTMFTFRKRS